MSNARTRSGSLTDTHLVILSAAAQRDDGYLTRPKRMPSATFMRATKQLLARSLLEEVAPGENGARPTVGEAEPHALRITAAGFGAMGIDRKLERADAQAEARPGRSRKRGANTRNQEHSLSASTPAPLAPVEAAGTSEPGPCRRGSKRDLILSLLSRKEGASIAELMAATGWLPHTTRAALTGLRRGGWSIERTKQVDGATVYRAVNRTAGVATGRAA